MAVRADLGSLMSGERNYNPFGGLMDDLFAPGTAYGGYVKNRPHAQTYDASALLRGGSTDTGISPWASIFGEGGRVLDPDALLRSLNVGSTLTQRPMEEQGFQRQYGAMQTPLPQGSPRTGYSFPPSNPQVLQQYGGAGGLGEWLMSLTDSQSRRFYDPNDLRYTGYELAPGVDIRNSTLQDLNQWAQQQYGVDLFTLAGSSPELLQARQAATRDPMSIFDPQNPGVLTMDRIPGLNDADSAARLSAYQTAVQNLMGETTRGMVGQGQDLLQQNQMQNEEANQTGLGRYLANLVGGLQSAQQAQQQNPADLFDYSYLMASGLQPFLMQRAGAGGGY
jgi:hypothetical protein